MYKRLLFCFITVLSIFRLDAQVLSDSASCYLLTCSPGKESWAKYGHSAILIRDPEQEIEAVFNYGIFDFNTQNFYYKFAIGDTWYQLGIEPFTQFIRTYAFEKRHVYWQQLNLTKTQKQQLLDALLVNYQPQNRYYHYNFVFDNCATRPYHLIKQVVGDTILSPYQGYLNTSFRQAIHHYSIPHCWLDFAINMVFGKDANRPMENEERLFLPEELMFYMSQAHLINGTPLVSNEHIEPFQIAAIPWWKTIWFGMGLFVLVMLAVSWLDRQRHHLSWGVDITLAIVWLLIGSVSFFLSNFSCHPLVGFNLRIVLFPILHLCTRLVYFIR